MTESTKGPLSVLKRIALVALTIALLLLVFTELVVRFVPLPGLSRAELNPAYLASADAFRTIPHPYLAYGLKPSYATAPDAKGGQKSHNSVGLRGAEVAVAKAPGTFRIACLGGSSTYGNTPTNDAATWPARLQVHLSAGRPEADIEVLNGGAPGWSSFESTVNLAFRMLDFEPDLVLVYHSINDVRCALYVAHEPLPDNSHWRSVWPVYRPSPLEPLLERSMTYLVWRKYFTDHLQQRADIAYFAIRDHPDFKSDWYQQGASVPTGGFDNFRRNLVSIAAVARAHGAEVIFASQGMDASDIPASTLSRANQLAGMQRMTALLQEVAQQRELLYLDAASALEAEAARQIEADGVDGIFTKEVHLTDGGADFLARFFADAILAAEIIP
jgi:hypothetical protein